MNIFEYLYVNDPQVTHLARDSMLKHVGEQKKKYPNTTSRIIGCMKELWRWYDVGGHSSGRSLRASILERAQELFRNGEYEKSTFLISLLVAMYHDTKYLKSAWHSDDPIFTHWSDSVFTDRVFLMTLVEEMKIEELPNLKEWEREKILRLLRAD